MLGYLHSIFSIVNITVSPEILSISVGVLQPLSTIISTTFIDKVVRKYLLLSSLATMALSLIFLGAYFQLLQGEFVYLHWFSWLPILSTATHIIGYGAGFEPVAFVFMSEVLPPDFKTRASALSIPFSGLTALSLFTPFQL